MPSTRTPLAYALAIVVGMSLWFWASLVSGRREAWDAAVYWTVAYPLALGVAGMMGYVFPQRPWRWALTLFMAQFAAMAIRNGELGGMWPMGMVLLALLSVPAMALGLFSAWLRGKLAKK